MAGWCRDRGVELAPHGKTHMAPQLLARQFEAGACAVTVATISQVRVYRAFGVRDLILANELVDAAALRWIAAEFDADPDFTLMCWVDSVAGVRQMASQLQAAGARRPVDVCVEVGMAGGPHRLPRRIGCRRGGARRRGLSCHCGWSEWPATRRRSVTTSTPEALARVTGIPVGAARRPSMRLADCSKPTASSSTAGGSTYFDVVADVLAIGWPGGRCAPSFAVAATSPTTTGCTPGRHRCGIGCCPALQVWAQVVSRPEPDLALLTMGRRDVSFDQDMPVPLGLSDSAVTKLNDQHAYLSWARRRAPSRSAAGCGSGSRHPCTTFDKWQMIPVLDDDDRVVDLIRTFF